MQISPLHPWEMTYREAVACQEELRDRLIIPDEDSGRPITTVAGADISYAWKSDRFFAAILLFSFPGMEIIEEVTAEETVTFPYIPGLLSFREGSALLKACQRLTRLPDVMIFDGQGIAHPRGIGLASHMGLMLDIPAIGCAKSLLVGRYAMPGEEAGTWTPLIHDNREVGAAVRTRKRVKPVFVSPGHRIGLRRSRDIILACCRGYRLPEPTRQAHLAVNRFRKRTSDPS